MFGVEKVARKIADKLDENANSWGDVAEKQTDVVEKAKASAVCYTLRVVARTIREAAE